MYVRFTSRKLADGTEACYAQLAYNWWDSSRGCAVPKVLHSFGRLDRLDPEEVRRLVRSLQRLLGPGNAPDNGFGGGRVDWRWSMPLGGAWALDGLWRQLGFAELLRRQPTARGNRDARERTAFALVAKQALASTSEASAHEWVGVEQAVPGVGRVSPAACDQALHTLAGAARQVSEQLVRGRQLDGTTVFLEVVDAHHVDAAAVRAHANGGSGREPGAASAALPAVLLCSGLVLAVTEDGVPLRYWSSPDDGTGAGLRNRIEAEVRAWKPARVVWVADGGRLGAPTRRWLERGRGDYLFVEDPRGSAAGPRVGLPRPDRRQSTPEDVDVTEIADQGRAGGDRWFVCHDELQTAIDRAAREHVVARLDRALVSANRLPGVGRAELARWLGASPVFGRFLTAARGLLRIDRRAVTDDEDLDGKVWLRTSDPTLSPEQAALAAARWRDTERGWCDMERSLDPRPVCRCCPDSVSAQVSVWWLGLMLTRLTEARIGQPWPQVRDELQRLSVGGFAGAGGTVERRTAVTPAQRRLLTALGVPEPTERGDPGSLN